jgi:DMSO/TMAO reductase YedYZ molybdopterin-dependent catalytic subunit
VTRRTPASVTRPSAPPGPFRRDFWRSPLRGPWLTSFLGALLLPLLLIVATTGFISHNAYQPQLAHNALVDPAHDLLPFIHLWPTSPAWLYALTQGLHVTVGLVTIPLLLAKLWSVIPRLFAWPPVRTAAAALERASLLLLVGGGLFEFATGVLNIQDYYPWHFGFVRAHYYGAWVFMAALALHVSVKLPVIARAYRERGFLKPLRDDLAHTRPEPPDPDGLAPVAPAAPTLSRRGLLALVGGASASLFAVSVGETVGGPLRRLALLAPRGRVFGTGPNDFQVNKAAVAAGVLGPAADPGWRLELVGRRSVLLTRPELMRLSQSTHDLPIACVEGWSTTQRWTGVALTRLRALVDAPEHAVLHVESLEPRSPYRLVTLSAGQVNDPRALLALCVNGVDLSLDHGYPARVIAPATPGVHCTKWVKRLTFDTA